MDATINKFGDVICPHCLAGHMTPVDMEVVPGELVCQLCGKRSNVTQEIIDKFNKEQACQGK